MKIFITLFLAVISVLLCCMDAAALAKRPAAEWAFFYFDGESFVAGRAAEGISVAIRPGVRPVVSSRPEALDAVQLPAGEGALVGLVYVQASGGKLRSAPGAVPLSQAPVRILAGEKVVATAETDANGYFVVVLPAGSYTVHARAAVEVKVEQGNTTLIPLRAGKRMVD